MKRVLILSGGNIDDTFALAWIKQNNYDLSIAADSGMEFFYRNGMVPDVIAGDFDSVADEAYRHWVEPVGLDELCGDGATGRCEADQEKKPEILRLNPVKDDTDTEYVIREAIRRGATAITVLGGTGTRLDHTLGNVHLLGIGVEYGVEIELVDAHNRIRMISDELLLLKKEQFGSYVSVLPFAGNAKGVTLEGLCYPLKDVELKAFSSLGISNEIVEDCARIKVEDGVLLVIEASD